MTARYSAAEDLSGDRGARLAGLGDRYAPHGRVRHRTLLNIVGAWELVTACGMSADEHDWLGTGTQAEYERLATMPRCARCIVSEPNDR